MKKALWVLAGALGFTFACPASAQGTVPFEVKFRIAETETHYTQVVLSKEELAGLQAGVAAKVREQMVQSFPFLGPSGQVGNDRVVMSIVLCGQAIDDNSEAELTRRSYFSIQFQEDGGAPLKLGRSSSRARNWTFRPAIEYQDVRSATWFQGAIAGKLLDHIQNLRGLLIWDGLRHVPLATVVDIYKEEDGSLTVEPPFSFDAIGARPWNQGEKPTLMLSLVRAGSGRRAPDLFSFVHVEGTDEQGITYGAWSEAFDPRKATELNAEKGDRVFRPDASEAVATSLDLKNTSIEALATKASSLSPGERMALELDGVCVFKLELPDFPPSEQKLDLDYETKP